MVQKNTVKPKGPWGGPRPNSGGWRPGAGRKPKDKLQRMTTAYYLDKRLVDRIAHFSDVSGHARSELVEQALREFFLRLYRDGFDEIE